MAFRIFLLERASNSCREVDRNRTVLLASLCLLGLLSSVCNPVLAQNNNYVLQTGIPVFTTAEPVELGFVNLANGNLHLEIPLTIIPERGRNKFTAALVYDSRFWHPNSNTNQQWVPGTGSDQGGWRLATTGTGGTVNYSSTYTSQVYYCAGLPYGRTDYQNFVFTAPDGTKRSFPGVTTWQYAWSPCGTPGPGISASSAYAQDASGYYMVVTNYTQAKVHAPDGTSVGTIKDTNGNFYAADSNYNIIDTSGRTPVIVTKDPANSNIIYYDVLASDGSRSRFTVTTTSVSISTAFGQLYVTEYAGTITAIQSIRLPNGTSYTFAYDSGTTPGHYGELTQVTLPSGGQIQYNWATFVYFSFTPESRSDRNRWVVGRTTPDGAWAYTPVRIGSACGDLCQIQVTVGKPDGNQAVYSFSKGFPTKVDYYSGSAGSGTLQKEITVAYDSTCDVRPMRYTTLLTRPGTSSLVSKVEYTYGDVNCWNRNIQWIKEWDYGSGVPGSLLRQTYISYLSLAQYTSINIIDRPLSRIVYDGAGNIVRQTQYAYDETQPVTTNGTAPGHDYTNYSSSFITRGNLTSEKRWRNTDGAWLTTTHTYDDLGNLRSTTDPSGHTTMFSYADSWGNASCLPTGGNAAAYRTSVTNALGQITRAAYNSCTGTVASTTDANNQTTTFSYDLMNRLTQTNFPDGGQLSTSYNDIPPVSLTTTTKLNPTTNLVSVSILDGLGRLKQTQLTSDPQGTVFTDRTYDSLGRIATVSNPYRATTEPTYGLTTQYDALSRVTKMIPPDGSTTANNVTTTYTGNCATLTDQAGKIRKSCTDALGRLTQVFEPDSAGNFIYETDYQYDLLDNLTRVDQKGNDLNSANWRTRTFTYNSLSQLLTATNPESGTISYAYDADGNLITKTAPAPNQTGSATVTTTFAYDALHRLKSKTYSDGTPTATYNYDETAPWGWPLANPIGRKTTESVSNASGTLAASLFNYDPMGRVTHIGECTPLNCAGTSFGVDYTYDLMGNPLTATNGVGVTISYAYNATARPTTVTSSFVDAQHPATLATVDPSVEYYPHGSIRKMTLGNNLTETAAYNNRLQPCRINVNWGNVALGSCSDPIPSSTNIEDFSVGYSSTANNGNLASWTGTGWLNFSRTYSYDALNRLATMADTASSQPCNGLSWSYDIWGNRTDQNVTAGLCFQFHAIVNAQNRLVGPPYQYDAAGNLIFDGSHSYTYDAENRIVQVDGGATATYLYDAEGQRVRKTAGGVNTEYIYDLSGNVVAEVGGGCGATCWRTGYVYLGGSLLAEYQNSTTYFVHKDHLGSTRLVTDYRGFYVTECNDFLPFGEPTVPMTPCASSNAPNPSSTSHKFTGKERDSESSLDFFGARYMGSALGRFMSPDPDNAGALEQDPQSWNGYAYARNNPLVYTDPDGLEFRICDIFNHCATIPDDVFFRRFGAAENVKLIGDQIFIRNEEGKFQFEGTFERISIDDPPMESANGMNMLMFSPFAGLITRGLSGATGGLATRQVVGEAAGGTATREAAGQVVVSGTKAAVREAIERGAVSQAQKAAVKSALNRAGSNATITVRQAADGSLRIVTQRAGRDGIQAIEKVIDATGKTVSVVQKAYDAAGKLVHVDTKLP